MSASPRPADRAMPEPAAPGAPRRGGNGAASVLERISEAAAAVPEWFVGSMPGPQGRLARRFYWRARLRRLGSNVTFGVGVRIVNPEWISIGDDVWIHDYVTLLAGPPVERGRVIRRKPNASYRGMEGELLIGDRVVVAAHSLLQAHGGLEIGADSGITAGCRIYSLSHHHSAPGREPRTGFKGSGKAPAELQSLICSPVVIGPGCSVGTNSVVLPGSAVGAGTWIGMLSGVVGEIPAGVVASGVPAVVRKRIG